MELLVEQLEKRVTEIGRWLEAELGEPAEVRIVRTDDRLARQADYDDAAADSMAVGGDWREPLDTTVWLRFNLRRPKSWPVEETALIVWRAPTPARTSSTTICACWWTRSKPSSQKTRRDQTWSASPRRR